MSNDGSTLLSRGGGWYVAHLARMYKLQVFLDEVMGFLYVLKTIFTPASLNVLGDLSLIVV
jgi:hypothetical protein